MQIKDVRVLLSTCYEDWRERKKMLWVLPDGPLWRPAQNSQIFLCLLPSLFRFLFALQSPAPPALALWMSDLSFSIDRPFGVYLYDYFDQLYTAVTGQSASKFAFVEGVTPFSTISEGRHSVQLNGFRSLENTHVCYLCLVVVSCITYLVVIFGTQYLLRDSQPLKPQFLFRVHNFLLTIVSLALLLLLIEQLVPQLARHGLYWTICSKDAWTEKHELLYYLNYLVKYWELIDTVFLVVKKKKLGKNEGLSTCNDGKQVY